MPALDSSTPATLVPPNILGIFIACVAASAALLDCALIAALVRRIRNGLYSLIIQLAVADCVLLITSVGLELWTANAGTWSLGRSACIAYRGINVFASSASLYLITTIALHTLATINLEEKTAQKSKRNTIVDDEEMRSSQHSLVASSNSSTPPRTMNVDYRPSSIVSITPPILFVWFLCVSLSIPEFALASTIRLENDTVVCALVDSGHKINIHSMLALFNFFLPTLIMTAAGVLSIIKLKSKTLRKNNYKDSIPALKLSISLISVYFLMCTPRSLVNMYGVYTTSVIDRNNGDDSFILITKLLCSSLFLLSMLVKPIVCISVIPRIRKKITSKTIVHV